MVRIPILEKSVEFRPTDQPTMRADKSVGEAMQGFGKAISGLGEAFAEQVNKEDDFNGRLAVLNFQNQQDVEQIKAQRDYNRDNPDGWALERQGGIQQGIDSVVSGIRNPQTQKWAKLHLESYRGNAYERDLRFEYNKRDEKLFDDTRRTIVGQFSHPALDDPSSIDDQLDKTMAGINEMVRSLPIKDGRERALLNEAAQLALKRLEETYAKAGKLDQYDAGARRLLERLNVRPDTKSTPGPQSDLGNVRIDKTAGDHAIVTAGSGARVRVASAYADRFAGLLADLEAEGVKVDGSQTGGYNDRNIAGTNTKSRHAFAEAIDVNWTDNPRGGKSALVEQIGADKLRAIAERNGLRWGGDWRNPDPMHFEVDRSISDVSARRTAKTTPDGPIATAYSPKAGGDSMEGGYASAKPGPDGKSEVRTLADVRAGRSKYVTIAGDASEHGKEYTIPEITYREADGKDYTLKDVRGVVHDTGSAFKGKGASRIDIPADKDLPDGGASQPYSQKPLTMIPAGTAPPKPVAERGLTRYAGLTPDKGGTVTDARSPNTIPGAQGDKTEGGAKDQAVADGGAMAKPAASHLAPLGEIILKHLPEIDRKAQSARDSWAKNVETSVKKAIEVAESGYDPRPDDIEAIRGELARKPELARQYGLDRSLGIIEGTVAEMQKLRQLRPQDLQAGLAEVERTLARDGANKEALAYKARLEKLLGSMRTAVDGDVMTWAEKTRVEAPILRPDVVDTANFTAGADDVKPTKFGPYVPVPRQQIALEPIRLDDPNLAARLAQRYEQAKSVAAYYDIPIQPWTKTEIDMLKDTFNKGGAPMLKTLGEIYKTFGNDTPAALKPFVKDAPEAALMGYLMANGGDPKLLEDSAKGIHLRVAEGDKFKSSVDETTVKAQKLDDVVKGPFRRVPGMQDPMIRMAHAVYNYRHRYTGKTSFDPALYDETMSEVMGQTTGADGVKYGGVGTQGNGSWWKSNSQTVIPPNVRTDSFDKMVDEIRDSDLATIGSPEFRDGTRLTAADIRGATWVYAGPNKYRLVVGTDRNGDELQARMPGRDEFFVLDLNKIMPELKRRAPGVFKP